MTQAREKEDLATEEAASWLLALEERPDDPSLRARFQRWLDADPAHAAAWTDASRIYAMINLLPPAHGEHWAPYAAPAGGPKRAASVAARTGRRAAGRGRTDRRRLFLGAAGAALAASLVLVLAPDLLLQVRADHRTSTGEIRSFRLEDGSRVGLAPESAIAVDLDDRGRRVRLLRGEAFFDVASDPQRPFHVAADGLTATVVGTAFNVRLGEGLTDVVVREGQVAVRFDPDGPKAPFVLTAGDWIRIDPAERVQHGRVPPEDVASWMEGRTIARDRAMSDVLDDLRRSYPGLILLTDEALGARRVTGVYDLADPVASVHLLAAPLGAAVRQITPLLLVISPG